MNLHPIPLRVMDRSVNRDTLRETIELMHASASVDSYYNAIERRELLLCGSNRTNIFISYARAAEKRTGWVARIRTHLLGVTRDSDLEVWDDSKIQPGKRWQEEIKEAVSRAKIAVLVLSADFMASEFIRDAELPLLLEAADAEGATILCLYGSETHLPGLASRLSKYQFVNSPDQSLQALSEERREQVYVRLAQEVEKAMRGT